MYHYEIIVRDFFTAQTVGVYGSFNTMKEVKNEILDIECLLQSCTVFSYQVVKSQSFIGRVLTLPELLNEGHARKDSRELVEA